MHRALFLAQVLFTTAAIVVVVAAAENRVVYGEQPPCRRDGYLVVRSPTKVFSAGTRSPS